MMANHTHVVQANQSSNLCLTCYDEAHGSFNLCPLLLKSYDYSSIYIDSINNYTDRKFNSSCARRSNLSTDHPRSSSSRDHSKSFDGHYDTCVPIYSLCRNIKFQTVDPDTTYQRENSYLHRNVHTNKNDVDVDTLKDQSYQSCCLQSNDHQVSQFYLSGINNNNNVLTNDTLSESVVNLSSLNLTPNMLSLLNKGLNFCPIPGEPDPNEIRQDLDKFHVSLRRKLFFQKRCSSTQQSDSNISMLSSQDINPDLDDEPFDNSQFKNPSSWCPKGPPNLESLISFNESMLTNFIPRAPANHNLSCGEKQALAELSHNSNIVIKPADKGSAVVIQNRSDYIQEAIRQLSNSNFYIETPEDLTEKHNKDIQNLVQDLLDNDEISPKCADYLVFAQPRTSQLYLLPKIHKKQTPVPGRPIVSANNSPTERISEFVDYFLKPLVQTTRSYVKDTTDFINKIEALPPLKENAILCTVDVTSLYTNIPNNEGISACAEILRKHRQGTQKPSNVNLARTIEYVLTKNNFDFNQKHYLQVGGTAMGTRVAPSFANLFMAKFEDKFVYPYHTQPSIWLRYIDDIFLVWENGAESLDLFLNHLNTCHPTIKFTSEHSLTHISFLDTTVKIDDARNLFTDLFCKSTDSHNYLRFDSAHPSHCKDSLPHSQFMRIRRICSRLEDYDRNAIMLGKHFARRGYPSAVIEKALITNRRSNRQELLHPPVKQDKNNDDNLFVINTYTPGCNPLKGIIDKNWPILGRTNTTDSLYAKNIIYGKRRNKNLRDLLVTAKLPDSTTTPKMQPLHKCIKRGNNPCRYCTRLNLSGSIISTSTRRSYLTKQYTTCKSNNLIYCMTCKTCNKQYVGQTKNTLGKRFSKHFDNIRLTKEDDPIGRHFTSSNHNGIDDVIIHVLDFIKAPIDSIPGQTLRDELERKWIHRLQTIVPLGINTVD